MLRQRQTSTDMNLYDSLVVLKRFLANGTCPSRAMMPIEDSEVNYSWQTPCLCKAGIGPGLPEVLFGLHGNSEIHKVHCSNLTSLKILTLLLWDAAFFPLRFIIISSNRALGRSLTSYFLQLWDWKFTFFWLRSSEIPMKFNCNKEAVIKTFNKVSLSVYCDVYCYRYWRYTGRVLWGRKILNNHTNTNYYCD